MSAIPRKTGDSKATGRIPVTLVTGFLGSGKTTLINAALRAPGMERTVIVVNEFGEVGLDHHLFATSSDRVVLLENGCLCCSVRGDLIATLNTLHQDRAAGEIPFFDKVIIEGSGVAEPGAVMQAFLSEPLLEGLYRLASVITLVDVVNWPSTRAKHAEATRQVALADKLLLTKIDLIGDFDQEGIVRTDIGALNWSAPIDPVNWNPAAVSALLTDAGFDARDAGADPRPWLNLNAHEKHGGHERALAHRHHHRFFDRGIESFVFRRDAPMSGDELQMLLEGIGRNLGPGLLRVKGLVNLEDGGDRPAVIQSAQHLMHNMTFLEKWPDEDKRTRIVFITEGVPADDLREMVEMLSRIGERTAAARAWVRAH